MTSADYRAKCASTTPAWVCRHIGIWRVPKYWARSATKPAAAMVHAAAMVNAPAMVHAPAVNTAAIYAAVPDRRVAHDIWAAASIGTKSNPLSFSPFWTLPDIYLVPRRGLAAKANNSSKIK
jgi:hypothetical protein